MFHLIYFSLFEIHKEKESPREGGRERSLIHTLTPQIPVIIRLSKTKPRKSVWTPDEDCWDLATQPITQGLSGHTLKKAEIGTRTGTETKAH